MHVCLQQLRGVLVIVLLLGLLHAATIVLAQNVQTGLLYWCSFVEGGSNSASWGTTGQPRAYYGYGTSPNLPYSAPCHLTYANGGPILPQRSDNFPHVYTNGTAYPDNNDPRVMPPGPYLISPSSCLVRIMNAPS